MNDRKTLTLRLAGAFILLAAIALTYHRTLDNGFVYDDNVQVVNNHWIKDAGYLPEIFTSHTFGYESEKSLSRTYRPVFLAVFTAEYALFGLNPRGWHLVNILLHAINAVLVFLLVRELLLRGPGARTEGTAAVPVELPAFLAALVFAVHPAAGEAVNWVSCVPELVYTLLSLVSFYLYMKSREGRPFPARALSAAAFFLALLTKEPALSLPLIIVFYDYARDGKKGLFRPGTIKRYMPYAAAIAVFFLMRMHALGRLVAPLEQMYGYLGAPQVLYNAIVLLARYLKTLLWPFGYYPFQVFTPFTSALEPAVYLSALALALISAVAFALRNRFDRLYITAFAFIFMPLLPALYIPGIMHHSFAYRYLYLPLFGFALLLSLLLRAAAARKKTLLASILAFYMIAASFAYAAAGMRGVADWKDEFSIWRASLKGSPGANFYAMYSLGNAYSRTGSHLEAIGWYMDAQKAIIRQAHPDKLALLNVRMELARAYSAAGAPQEALAVYKGLEAEYPGNRAVFMGAGNAFEGANLLDEAVSSYGKALERARNAPEAVESYFYLARAYFRKGDLDRALICYEEILRLSPGNADAERNIEAVRRARGAP